MKLQPASAHQEMPPSAPAAGAPAPAATDEPEWMQSDSSESDDLPF